MKKSYRSKISFEIKRFKDFWTVFRHNRRGLSGVGILIFFSVMALSAPLLTPNDPVYGKYVAGDYAVPAWLKYFPGGEGLNENFELAVEPGFPTPSSIEEWNLTSSAHSGNIVMKYEASMGSRSTGLGCVAITFSRENPYRYAGRVKAHLSKEFYFPYNAPPKRFVCPISVLAEGVEDVPVHIKVLLERVENESYRESYILWNTKFTRSTPDWVTPVPAIDSYESGLKERFGSRTADPAKIVFSKPANYILRVEVLFTDSKRGTLGEEVKAVVYIDDLNLRLYGNAYGLLGTDQFGRDIFAQLVYGAQISLMVGLLSAILSVVIGLVIGLVSGYIGGFVDEILMRFTDMMLVLPTLPLLLVLIAVLGPSLWHLITIIGLLGWMSFARWVRSSVLSLKERPFVEAARAVGAGKFHIIVRHIFPNVISLVYVSLALSVPNAIISEAALSWLGLYDPTVMSWGRMLHDAQQYYGVEKWWWIGPPGICIALVSVSFILLGYALDEILNPKLRRRR